MTQTIYYQQSIFIGETFLRNFEKRLPQQRAYYTAIITLTFFAYMMKSKSEKWFLVDYHICIEAHISFSFSFLFYSIHIQLWWQTVMVQWLVTVNCNRCSSATQLNIIQQRLLF